MAQMALRAPFGYGTGRDTRSRLLATLLLLILALGLGLDAAPRVYAASPAADGGSAASGSLSSPNTGSVSTTLNTSLTGDLVVAIVFGEVSTDLVSSVTYGAQGMTLKCDSASSPRILVYYWGPTTGTGPVAVTATFNGGSKGDTIGIAALGVNGYNQASPFDGASPYCGTGAGTASPASATTTTLTYGNDLIVGGVAVNTGNGGTPPTCSLPCTLFGAASPTNKWAIGAGWQLGVVGQPTPSMTFTVTGGSMAWTELVAAIASSTPIDVPLFPDGLLPLLAVLPVAYLLFRSRVQGRGGGLAPPSGGP